MGKWLVYAWVCLGLVAVLTLAGAAEADWPQFRGPFGNGHASSESVGLPVRWSEGENVRWKVGFRVGVVDA